MKRRATAADRTAAVRRAVEAACGRAMAAIGTRAERYARARAPVRTGRLRESIHHRASARQAAVYSEAEYAVWVELGRGDPASAGARPFLGPALLEHGEEYRELLYGELSRSTERRQEDWH